MNMAVVTGSGSGIGASIATTVTDRFDYAVDGWDLTGDPAVDVTDPASIDAAVGRLDGELRAVVLAAGVSRMAPLVETSDEDWHHQMSVNAYGVFACLRALVPRMVDGAAIVVIDSMGGLRAAPLLSAYCASKYAVTGLIESVAPELAPRGIRLNAVCPMYVRTPMQNRELEWEASLRGMTPAQVFQEYEATTPLGRVAEPQDVANCVAFLLGDDAGYLTGVTLPVSGGAHLGFTYTPLA